MTTTIWWRDQLSHNCSLLLRPWLISTININKTYSCQRRHHLHPAQIRYIFLVHFNILIFFMQPKFDWDQNYLQFWPLWSTPLSVAWRFNLSSSEVWICWQDGDDIRICAAVAGSMLCGSNQVEARWQHVRKRGEGSGGRERRWGHNGCFQWIICFAMTSPRLDKFTLAQIIKKKLQLISNLLHLHSPQ